MLIYKFCSPTRLNALENAKLRATQASALNDPFELKPFFNAILERAELEDRMSEERLFEEMAKKTYAELPTGARKKLPLHQFLSLIKQPEIRAKMRADLGAALDDLMASMPKYTAMFRDALYKKLEDHVGIVSFTQIATETLMWSHYAQDHTGFAIAFESGHPFFDRRRSTSDEFFHLRDVTYGKAASGTVKISDLDGTQVLCAKQSNWKYERELRLLIPVNPDEDIPASGGEPIHLIDFSRDSVREVILGAKAMPELEDQVRAVLARHAEYAAVKVRRARTDFSTGDIVIDG